MKTPILILILSAGLGSAAFGQGTSAEKMGAVFPGLGPVVRPLSPEDEERLAQELIAERTKNEAEKAKVALAAEQARILRLPPVDPWRRIGGELHGASEAGWYKFWGKVAEVRADGLVVAGSYWRGGKVFGGTFEVVNFPRATKRGEVFDFGAAWWA